MSKRGKQLTEAEIEVLKVASDITKEERMTLVKKGRKK